MKGITSVDDDVCDCASGSPTGRESIRSERPFAGDSLGRRAAMLANATESAAVHFAGGEDGREGWNARGRTVNVKKVATNRKNGLGSRLLTRPVPLFS